MGQWIYARSAPARSNLLMHPHSNCRTCFSGCRSLYKVGVNRYYCGQSTPTLQGAIMFDLSPRIQDLKQKLEAFMDEHIYPNEELRSEEHTSELQSRENLVCRLLLEKKTTN